MVAPPASSDQNVQGNAAFPRRADAFPRLPPKKGREMQDPSFWQLFNWLDLVLAIGIVAAFLIGLGAGFYRQLAITSSLVLGLILASQLTNPLAAASFWEPIHARLGQNGRQDP